MIEKHPITKQVEILALNVGTVDACTNATEIARKEVDRELATHPKAQHYGRLDALEGELIDLRERATGFAREFVENVIQYLESLKRPLQGIR